MSTRQDILTLLDTALKTILTTNGYNTNAGKNVYEWEDNQEESSLPAIFWRDLSSRVEHEDVSFNKQRHFLSVDIEFLSSGNTSPTTTRQVLEDITSCLYTNRKWGGNARWTSLDEHELTTQHNEKKITGGRIVCVIEYDTDLGSI